VWDGNPEIFEIDLERLGQPNLVIPAGSSFSASGVMAYEFGGYEAWPANYTFSPTTLPRPVRTRAADEASIATLNLHLFFDEVDDPNLNEPVPTAAAYQTKLSKLSKYIRDVMRAPEILAVQEAENLNALFDLAGKIKNDDATLTYTPYLVEGNDVGGIDVGFLVHSSITVDSLVQLGATEIFSFDNTLLHDRPPLVLRAKLPDGKPLSVMNLHLRSLNGIDDPLDGQRARQKRHEQASSVSFMVQTLQTEIDTNLVVLGDFNAYQFTDGYVHVLGQIIGAPADASQALIPGSDNVNPDLINEALALPAEEQYSFVFRGSAEALDHALVSQALHPAVTGVDYARSNADAAEILVSDSATALRASDHDGLVLYVKIMPTGVEEDKIASVVTDYALLGNYPNPFNPSTAISFAMPEAGKVTLRIYTVTGQLVRTLANGNYASGKHSVVWNGKDERGAPVASGVYLYHLEAKRPNGVAFTQTRRMALLK
jgi:predicted extracellular nuclease